jgi:hypothetical protein
MFLVCDPYPASDTVKPDKFLVTGLGAAEVDSAARVNADGSVDMHLDLTGTPDGTYTVTVKASLAGNASAASASFTFTLPVVHPSVPGIPQNIRLSDV